MERWNDEANQLIKLVEHYKDDLSQLALAPERLRSEVTILAMARFGAVSVKYAPEESLQDKAFALAAIKINPETAPYFPQDLVAGEDIMMVAPIILPDASQDTEDSHNEEASKDVVKEEKAEPAESDGAIKEEKAEPAESDGAIKEDKAEPAESEGAIKAEEEESVKSDDAIKVAAVASVVSNDVNKEEKPESAESDEDPDESTPDDDAFLVHSPIGDARFVLDGVKRWFIEPLGTEMDSDMDHTTPYQLQIEDHVITTRAWSDLLVSAVNYLNQKNGKGEEELLAFRTRSSETPVFIKENKVGYKLLDNGLFMRVNHNAAQSCLILGELLQFYGIKLRSAKLLINRPVGLHVEPVREEITKRFKEDFSEYISEKYSANPAEIINIIETQINPVKEAMSPSYPDLFFFDDAQCFKNAQTVLCNRFLDETRYPDDKRIKVLEMLRSYYASERFKENYPKWFECFVQKGRS